MRSGSVPARAKPRACDLAPGIGPSGSAPPTGWLHSAAPIDAPVRRVRRRAARPVSGWGSLTVAEERVARSVAQGHTNAEAGAELFVSARTVESHLRRIFAKLEIRKRVELAVLVSQLADHRTDELVNSGERMCRLSSRVRRIGRGDGAGSITSIDEGEP